MTVVGVARKQPNDVLDYDIDFSEWLPEGDAIISAFVTVAPSMPISPTYEIDPLGKRVKVWVYAGGISGVTYQITVRASTSGGRVKEVELRVKIKEV